jgi:ADP-ribose pyrophosphatase YjhB (NUDIX family)
MGFVKRWNYCPVCGGELETAHDGEGPRPHCAACDRYFYDNPVPCVTAVLETEGGILLVLRGKEPRAGHWALPGGFLDLGESPEEGARREFQEETGLEPLRTELIGLSAQHSDRFGTVVYAGYEVTAFRGTLQPGSDAAEARFFPRDRMPPLAFDSLQQILRLHLRRHPRPPGS